MSFEDKLSTIGKNKNPNINNNSSEKELIEVEEKYMKYRNLPHDLNNISLKTRFTYRKIIEIMENNKEEDLTLEEYNDPKKSEIFKKKLNKKLIQYYCMENAEKNKFAPPSEKTMNKLQQFKKWQKFEMFQKDGIKNYLNNILPDYKLIFRTRNLIDNNINMYTKLRIKNTNNSIILPSINNANYLNNNSKELDLFNDQSQSYVSSILDRNKNQKVITKNNSNDDFNNYSSISKIIHQEPVKSEFKRRKMNSRIDKYYKSLINLQDNTKHQTKNQSLCNINKEIKSFENSSFCYNKVKVPLSVDKSITISPYGGCIFYNNSLLRNKSMNDLLDNPSRKKILPTLIDYKTKRSKIINNKDYLQHIGKTFITINRQLTNYDYNIF